MEFAFLALELSINVQAAPGLAARANAGGSLLASDGSVIEGHRDLSLHGFYAVDVDELFREARELGFGLLGLYAQPILTKGSGR